MTLASRLLIGTLSYVFVSGCAHCIHYGDPDIMLRREGGWRVNPWVVAEMKYDVAWCDQKLFRVIIEEWTYPEPVMDSAHIDSLLVFAADSAGSPQVKLYLRTWEGEISSFGTRDFAGMICLDKPLPAALVVNVFVTIYLSEGGTKVESSEYLMFHKDHWGFTAGV